MSTLPDPDVERKGEIVENRAEDSASADEKPAEKTVEDNASVRLEGGLQPPEFIRNLTPEKRAELEKALKRKIDIRLLPAIIIMYILNYIDRYVSLLPNPR